MNKEDYMRVLKGAAIAAAGALLAYLADAAAGGALGVWGLALAPLISVGINAIRKWLESQKSPPAPPAPPTPPAPWVAAILAVLLLGGFAMADLKIVGETKV